MNLECGAGFGAPFAVADTMIYVYIFKKKRNAFVLRSTEYADRPCVQDSQMDYSWNLLSVLDSIYDFLKFPNTIVRGDTGPLM